LQMDLITAATQKFPTATAPSHLPKGRVRSITCFESLVPTPTTDLCLLRSAGRIRPTDLLCGPIKIP